MSVAWGIEWPWTERELLEWELQPCFVCNLSPVNLWTAGMVFCEDHGPDDLNEE